MTEPGTDEKISIKAAAEFLGVTTKTIQRYLLKGLFSKVKEGTRTYLYLSEVRTLEKNRTSGQGQSISPNRPAPGARHSLDLVTVKRERYESLLIELGELRKQSQFISEYREALQKRESELRDRDKEIDNLRSQIESITTRDRDRERDLLEHLAKIRELEAELERFKSLKPWWQR